jgi:intraflagellar transport protein 81
MAASEAALKEQQRSMCVHAPARANSQKKIYFCNLESNSTLCSSALSREVAELQERRQRAANPEDATLVMYKQQAANVLKKKTELMDRENMLAEDRDRLKSELAEKEKEIAAKGGRLLRGEEWREYKRQINEKRDRCVRFKRSLGDMKAETGVLQRTETVLQGRLKDPAKYDAEEKKRAGSELGSAQSRLEAVSEATAALNEVKGKTLEEISKVVQEIQTQTKERKERLQPLIVKMRQMRTDVAELEQEHGRKKAVYESTAGSLGAEKSKLEAEVKALNDECTLQESQIHVVTAQMQMTAMQLERVSGEASGGKGSLLLGQFKSYRQLYQHRTQELENLSKTLRERQREVRNDRKWDLR